MDHFGWTWDQWCETPDDMRLMSLAYLKVKADEQERQEKT